MTTTNKLTPGIYFDNTRGWHIAGKVCELALEHDWNPEDATYRDALKVLASSGLEAFEDFCAEEDPELLTWLEADAQAYIDDHLVPEGCWAGYSEGFGDWGVWELEEEA